LGRAPAQRGQFHSRAGPDSAARGVRSPGSHRRVRLASHTRIRCVAVPCRTVFRRDCPNFFVTIAVCVQPGGKGIGVGSGIASSSLHPSAIPQRRGGDDKRVEIVAEPSRATRASSLPPRVGGRSASLPPHARPTHAREIRFTNNDNGSAGARVAEPGRDALRQPRTARLSLFEPNFARLTALAVPLRQNRLFGSLEQGGEEDKRAEQLAHAGRRLYRGFRVFCIVRVNRRCSTTPARARALPAATRASSLLA